MSQSNDSRYDPEGALILLKAIHLHGPNVVAADDADDEARMLVQRINEEKLMLQKQQQQQDNSKTIKGRFTLEEAAREIANGEEHLEQVLNKLKEYALQGAIPVYEPGRNLRCIYGPNNLSRVREFYEEVYWDDLNKLLEQNEQRIPFRFPAPPNALLSSEEKQQPLRPEMNNTITASDIREPEVGMGSKTWRKQNAKAAADVRHSKPGGSREKQVQIREIWASGKYTTRDRCAEEECGALGMSFSAARRALENTPDPKK